MIELDDSNRLCKIGGVAALTIPVFYVVAAAISGIGYRFSPVPNDVTGWFALFQTKPLLGFVYLGIQDAAIAVLSVPLFLALYQVHKDVGKTWSLVAAVFAVIGVGIYLAMHTSFSLFSLSSQYARATTDATRFTILTGAQALIADPRMGIGMALIWVSALTFSLLMLRGKSFGIVTSAVGIAGFTFLLLGLAVPAGYTNTDPHPLTIAETVIIVLSIGGGGVLSLLWYILVGLKLLRLGGPQKDQAHPLKQFPNS